MKRSLRDIKHKKMSLISRLSEESSEQAMHFFIEGSELLKENYK